MSKTIVKTSEAVSVGHPDKVADQIGDAILDLLRKKKKNPQTAVEVALTANNVVVYGEIDSDIVKHGNGRLIADRDPLLAKEIEKTVIRVIKDIGYTKELYNPDVIIELVTQSEQINSAVEDKENSSYSAGDQGIVFGYATDETVSKHGLHFIIAHRLLERLEKLAYNNDWMFPDAKSQVSVVYEDDTPVRIDNIVISMSHSKEKDLEFIQEFLKEFVLKNAPEILKEEYHEANDDFMRDTKFYFNPAGEWNTPGPRYDSGVLGRKLVVDNYGSESLIGGGAGSGKNATKVDRSGAYYARNIARSIIDSGYADKCLVELGFAIGIDEPTAINIDTFGTETIPKHEIMKVVKDNYSFKVDEMVSLTDSVESFLETSKHGHYTSDAFPWEVSRKL